MTGENDNPREDNLVCDILDVCRTAEAAGLSSGQIMTAIARANGCMFGVLLHHGHPRSKVHELIESAGVVSMRQADFVAAFGRMTEANPQGGNQ